MPESTNASHAESPSIDPPHPSKPFRQLRSRIMAGLVLVVPMWFTYVVVMFVFRLMRDASLWIVEAALLSPLGQPLLSSWDLQSAKLSENGLQVLPWAVQWGIDILSVILTIVTLYLLGTVTTNVVGRKIVRLAETVVERVPMVTVVYHASKKVLETLVGDGARPFQRVVLVPFPNKDTYSVGFVSRVMRDCRSGEALYTVFVATAPNPTTGFVLVIRPSDVVELDWTVEEAVKVIMSGGVLMPDAVPFPGSSVGNCHRSDHLL
jgi:uncharacterized membrane protein